MFLWIWFDWIWWEIGTELDGEWELDLEHEAAAGRNGVAAIFLTLETLFAGGPITIFTGVALHVDQLSACENCLARVKKHFF